MTKGMYMGSKFKSKKEMSKTFYRRGGKYGGKSRKKG